MRRLATVTAAATFRATETPQGYLGGIGYRVEPTVVTLRPGAVGSAMLEGTDFPADGQKCGPHWGIAVRLPRRSTRVRLRFAPGLCRKVQMHPIGPGTTGNLS